MTDEVRVRIDPLKRDESKGVIRLHADTLQAKLSSHRSLREGGQGALARGGRWQRRRRTPCISGAQKLFRVSCVLVLREKNLDSLRKKAGSLLGQGDGRGHRTRLAQGDTAPDDHGKLAQAPSRRQPAYAHRQRPRILPLRGPRHNRAERDLPGHQHDDQGADHLRRLQEGKPARACGRQVGRWGSRCC